MGSKIHDAIITGEVVLNDVELTATAAELNIMDGVTASTAELNIMDGVTATAAELNALDAMPSSQSTITLGTPVNDTQTVSVQLKDSNGANISGVRVVRFYYANDSIGSDKTSTSPGTGITFTAGEFADESDTASTGFVVVSEADGTIAFTINNDTGVSTYDKYVVMVLPNGSLRVSDQLAVPDNP